MKTKIYNTTYNVILSQKKIVCTIKTNMGTFTGNAVCAAGDAWDEVLGKRVSESKAKIKMFRHAKNILAESVADLQRYLDEDSKALEKYEAAYLKELGHQQDLRISSL